MTRNEEVAAICIKRHENVIYSYINMSNLPVEHRVLRKDRENMITSYRMVFLAACFACLCELCSVPNSEAHDVYVILISIGQVLTPYRDVSQFVVRTCQVI